MMLRRCFLAGLSCAALSTTAVAQCPPRFQSAPAAWGTATAASGEDLKLYQPPGLALLGRPVPFVIVEQTSGTLDVYYRLGGESRGTGQPLSAPLRAAFTRAYPKGDCGDSLFSCSEYVPASRTGDLRGIDLQDEEPPGYEPWTGTGARLIQAEDKALERGMAGVYLICRYDPA